MMHCALTAAWHERHRAYNGRTSHYLLHLLLCYCATKAEKGTKEGSASGHLLHAYESKDCGKGVSARLGEAAGQNSMRTERWASGPSGPEAGQLGIDVNGVAKPIALDHDHLGWLMSRTSGHGTTINHATPQGLVPYGELEVRLCAWTLRLLQTNLSVSFLAASRLATD